MVTALLMILGSFTLAALGGAVLAKAEEKELAVVVVKTQPLRQSIIDLRNG